jgi:NAD-dependent dihydropyrimidine dehydrogenase PreA subunit
MAPIIYYDENEGYEPMAAQETEEFCEMEGNGKGSEAS